jgi:D-amino-acid dehydrogenase
MAVLRELGVASRALFDELAAVDGLSFELHRDGLLQVYGRRDAHEAGVEEAALLQALDIDSTVLDREALQKRLGDLPCTGAGGVFYPDDAHIDPGRFVCGLADKAKQMGVDVRSFTEVLGWQCSGRRVATVHTTRGDLRPGQIVLAAGAWSSSVVRDLGLHLPIQAAKGYSVTVKRPATCPSLPMLLGETRVAVTPLADTLRLGGTLELAGMDLSINRQRVQAILSAVRRFFPTLEQTEVIEIWRGLRPCTPDGLPFLGRSERYDNLIVAAGHGTLGVSLGPATGKLVSQIVRAQPTFMDVGQMKVERFG